MITVIIPTLNPPKRFGLCLAALVPAAIEGLVSDVVVVDGGSNDPFVGELAGEAGATFVKSAKGRGTQMAFGAQDAKGQWLMFLHADTVLEQGWEQEAARFIKHIEIGEKTQSAAAFRFALDDFGVMPRFLEKLVALRCLIFKLPYGDQGVLISKKLYQSVGGFKSIPLMEDVDIVRRLGRSRIMLLQKKAVTSAIRYKTDGYLFRMMRNFFCLLLYYLRVPPRTIERFYD
ncbi:MAG: TIGR04283 family arsenosugar biosynthesis glycosyltransferase [Pseudomonadota bacterium]